MKKFAAFAVLLSLGLFIVGGCSPEKPKAKGKEKAAPAATEKAPAADKDAPAPPEKAPEKPAEKPADK